MLPSPTLTFGPTLARLHRPEATDEFVNNARLRRGRGSVMIVVTESGCANHLDVDATVQGLSPSQALDALAIASARLGVIHRVPASASAAIWTDEAEELRQICESIVDRQRAFGWWEKFCGMARWLSGGASFKHDRETCVRQLMQDMAAWRARETAAIAEAA